MSEATDGTEVPAETERALSPGLYGKVSKKGDFVTRRLPRGFTGPWDAWLQAAMAHSRKELGNDWLPAYLNAPIWRFALSAGVCGDSVVAGVLMPSIDKVGRHFPLALAVQADPEAIPSAILAAGADWFADLEDLALSTLEDDFEFEAFDKALEVRDLPPGANSAAVELGAPQPFDGKQWRFAADPSGALGGADPLVMHQILRGFVPRHSLWWSAGSQRVAPSFLVCENLPASDGFIALLDGDWERWNWSGTKPGAMPWTDTGL